MLEKKLDLPWTKLSQERPSWEEYWMEIARLSKERSTCLKENGKNGCVIVRDNILLSMGYCGPPIGEPHCDQLGGCIRPDAPHGTLYELCRSVHAEMNAIVFAARNGVSVTGSEIFITTSPCPICFRMLRQAGILRIVVDGKEWWRK